MPSGAVEVDSEACEEARDRSVFLVVDGESLDPGGVRDHSSNGH